MAKRIILLFTLAILFFSFKEKESQWIDLLNYKDFSNWNVFVLKPEKRGENENEMKNPPGWLLPKVFISDNPDSSAFKFETIDNKKVLHLSGELMGFLTSKQEYENYHLKMKFKFGKKWAWLGDRPRDGGIFYHVIHASSKEEKATHEFNIHDGDIGSYWSFGGYAEIPCKLSKDLPGSIKSIISILKPVIPSLKDSMYRFDSNGGIRTFSNSIKDMQICIVNPVADKPCGEWNELDLICLSDTVIHAVNGKVVMVLYNSRYKSDENKLVPLKRGAIKIQSEGGEQFIEYIKISRIKEIPMEFKYSVK